MSRIGDKIKKEREKKGLTPKQVARKCGVSESFILDVESGKKIIAEKQLKQLSKVLGKNLEETMMTDLEEGQREEIKPKIKEMVQPKRKEVAPLGQWEDALSNIIKNIPIYDVGMKRIKGYKKFPIINKKVEGFNSDKLIYIEAEDQELREFRICKGDKILIYLNQQMVNNSVSLIEYDGKIRLRKVKRGDANKIQIISHEYDRKVVTRNINDVKIIGRGIRVEIDLK